MTSREPTICSKCGGEIPLGSSQKKKAYEEGEVRALEWALASIHTQGDEYGDDEMTAYDLDLFLTLIKDRLATLKDQS